MHIPELVLVAINTFVIYIFLIMGFRFIGRRQLGQLTIVDLVIIVIMGSAVETAMVNGDTSLQAGLVSTATLLVTNRLLTMICMSNRRLRRFISGGPVVLISHCHIVEEKLKRVGMTHDDLMEAIRGRGCCELEDVRFAVMEDDGEITVIPTKARTVKTEPVADPARQAGLRDAAAS